MITILADDLSGAQEALAAASRLGPEPRSADALLLLDPADIADIPLVAGDGPDAPSALAVDLHARGLPEQQAAARLEGALDALAARGRLGGDRRVLIKTDSILRGPVGALAAAAARHAPVVLCPAVPALERSAVGGIVHVHGVPLHRTALWAAETAAAPRAIAEVMGPAELVHADLATLRAGELASLLAPGRIVIADAQSAEDCRAVADAADGAILVGAGGLAAALEGGESGTGAPPAPADARATTLAVGSAAAGTRAQIAALAEARVPVMPWAPGARIPPAAGDRALVIDVPLDPSRADELADAFTRAVAAADAGEHLVLTGGQTARAVLDQLGVRTLRPLVQPHHGAVVARTEDGRLVATRPGSFGDPRSLLDLLTSLHDIQHPFPEGLPA